MSGRSNARLGRGLASLLGEDASVPASRSGTLIAIEQIEPGPFQPRSDITPASLDELTSSIRQQGILQPILIRPNTLDPDRFQIIAGERRWRAARAAGLIEIPCFIRLLSDQEAMAAALVENLQRQDLNPIEEAEGFRRLIQEFGLTQDELGLVLGKSRSHVTNQLRLLQLTPEVSRLVQQLQLSAGHARAILSSSNPEEAAQTILSKGLNVRQAEALCARPDRNLAVHETRPADPNIEAAQADLAEHLGLKVAINFNGRGGSVKLHYQSVEQLDHIVALLGRS